MARFTVSIRSGLLVSLIVLIVILGGAIVLVAGQSNVHAVRTLSGQLIRRQLAEIEARLDGYFEPARQGLRAAEGWGERGLLDLEDPDRLRALLEPVLRVHPEVLSSALVADTRGREFMLLHLPGGHWRNRLTRRDEWGGRVRWIEWTDEDPAPVERWEELPYDPRERPWFQGARKRAGLPSAERVSWTEPYTFYTTKQPGITTSVAFRAPDGADMVVGFDVLLEDISKFTVALGRREGNEVFVLTDHGLVIGLTPAFDTEEKRRDALAPLRDPDALGLDVVSDAMRALGEDPDDPVRFTSGGGAWWGDVDAFPLGGDRRLHASVLVPERLILANLAEIRSKAVVITLGVLLLAVVLALVLARRFSQPVEQLVHESERISRGHLEPGEEVRTRVAELHRLADAQERMRDSLQKLFRLEGDLRLARQIQQDTWPDRLPALRGFELVGLSEPADETGGDCYDVVGLRDGALSQERADRAVLLLADATGHGIGPALSAVQARAMLRIAARNRTPLAEIVRQMNEQLCDDLEAARFVTAWFGEVDATNGTLTSFSAGQGPLLRYEAAADRWTELGSNMPPLGVLRGFEVVVPAPFALAPGDLFVVLSDGFFEAAAPDGELFGSARVTQLLGAHRRETLPAMLEALRTAVESFTAGAPAADDRTALIVKRT